MLWKLRWFINKNAMCFKIDVIIGKQNAFNFFRSASYIPISKYFMIYFLLKLKKCRAYKAFLDNMQLWNSFAWLQQKVTELHSVANVPVSGSRRLLLLYLLPWTTKGEKQVRIYSSSDSKLIILHEFLC